MMNEHLLQNAQLDSKKLGGIRIERIDASTPVHPFKSQAKVLLSSIFGPYAQDDEYGSRKINPMELYHNQVTRVQGPFSLRMFHRSFGLMLLQANMDAPCTLLDFPTLDRFIEEIKNHSYDIIGIGSILPNLAKTKKMCELIRQYSPKATIVVGGHIAAMPDLESFIDADYIVMGDGVRWFQHFLGEKEKVPVRHPMTLSGFGGRVFGIPLPKRNTAAILIPSVGCPLGCNFCSTSALFGGKGNFVSFYETGDDLFSVMCEIEKNVTVQSFFILDENFLLHQKRALRLLELMQQHHKSWSLYVFSSARALKRYSIEQLVRLGISWVWMGLEGRDSQYTKLDGIDTPSYMRELQSNGIRVLGSTIIGLENHTKENIDQIIDWAVSHNTIFHQFMLYMPLPGTALYEQTEAQGNLLSEEECSSADAHGQDRFNYRHKNITGGEESEFLLRAFRRDFEVNGPSMARMFQTMLMGWRRYKDHPDPCIRARFEREVKKPIMTYTGAVWAMKKWYKEDKPMLKKMTLLFEELCSEFGWKTRFLAPLVGRVIYVTMKREGEKLASGLTYEPATFYEKNAKAQKLEGG